MFETFDSFAFNYENLAQPIDVIKVHETDDELGNTTKVRGEPVRLYEPIINTQNPNVAYSNGDGGQYPTVTYNWESKHSEYDKGDIVIFDNNEFKVTAKAVDVASHLWFYTLKRVGDN